MSGIWPDWLKAIQLKARYLFGIWSLGLFILLMPKAWADALRIEPIRDTTGGFIGIASITAFVFWLVALIEVIEKWREQRKQVAVVLEALDSLSRRERFLLSYCLVRKRQTLLLPGASSEGNTAAGLCQKGVMIRAAGMQNILAWPHLIPPFVWKELCRRQHEFLLKDDAETEAMKNSFRQIDKIADGQRGAMDDLW
jgi:hypothetical protein